MVENNQDKSLNVMAVNEDNFKLINERFQGMRPSTLMNSINSFEEEKYKILLTRNVLKAFRDNKIDIRRFNFKLLTSLVNIVSQY